MNRSGQRISAVGPYVIGVLCLWLFGCQQGAPAAEEPVWGKQPCSHCAMLLTERVHGAQVLTTKEDRLFFDDVGCLVAWESDHPGQSKQIWVRQFDQDPKGTEWLRADQAKYLRARHTPMDFGFVAVAKVQGSAGAEAAVAWRDVVAAVKRKLQGP